MKLFAVMMIKDEEENLKRCIPTIKPFVDEIIVVDTGSTDRTVEYLKAQGAKVFEHPWEDDYSIHRNQGIQHAKDEGADWIFIVDADEELIGEIPLSDIRRKLESSPADCKVLTLRLDDIQKGKVVMTFPTPRFFDVDVVQYKNFIHNKPKYGESKVGALTGCYLNHYGYDEEAMGPEKTKIKSERRTALLLKKQKDEPDNIEIYFYLSQDYSLRNDNQNAIKSGTEYIERCKKVDVTPNSNVYYTALRSAMNLGWKKTAAEILAMAITDASDYIDIAFITVEMGFWINRMELVESGATHYMELYFRMEQGEFQTRQEFVFTHNIDSLAYIVNSLAMIKLQQGVFQLTNLKGIFPAVSENLKPKIKSALRLNLEQLNLLSLMDMIEDVPGAITP